MAKKQTPTDLRAAIATVFLERRRAIYRKTNNPVHVWLAYRAARHLKVPVPIWVLDYLDRCAKGSRPDSRWRGRQLSPPGDTPG